MTPTPTEAGTCCKSPANTRTYTHTRTPPKTSVARGHTEGGLLLVEECLYPPSVSLAIHYIQLCTLHLRTVPAAQVASQPHNPNPTGVSHSAHKRVTSRTAAAGLQTSTHSSVPLCGGPHKQTPPPHAQGSVVLHRQPQRHPGGTHDTLLPLKAARALQCQHLQLADRPKGHSKQHTSKDRAQPSPVVRSSEVCSLVL